MNFKRNLFLITCALVGGLALSSCEFSAPTSFKSYDVIKEIEDNHKDIEKDGYIKYGNYASYKVRDTHGGEAKLGSPYEVFRDHAAANHIPSEGKQKIIVVPVDFSDYKSDKLNLTDAQFIENVNKAFFGNNTNNAYLSVAEYFNRSSYGKFQLSGKVCDKMFTFPTSVKNIKGKKIQRDKLAIDYYPEVLKWYSENYDDIEDYKIEGLKSGKNVPIFMVYTYPGESGVEKDSEDFFWAYTFNDVPLSWASSSFMYLSYGEPDAHTYIHETGHLLGLSDYYPTVTATDETFVIPDPAGRIDMMDCSIGDETSFSKMLLNWARPYYVTDSCEIEIESFTTSGDFILLANSWNKTAFDEYYLIEFYTPTGLNTYDVSYGNSEAKLPTMPGIKLYHVDARLAYFSNQKTITGYCEDSAAAPTSNNMNFAHDNNTYEKPNSYQKNYLYQLVLNNSTKMINGCANDSHLYRGGDEIKELKLNRDDSTLNFNISITSVEFSKATISIEKTA